MYINKDMKVDNIPWTGSALCRMKSTAAAQEGS